MPRCERCGASIDPTSQSCAACGAAVGARGAYAATQPPATPTPPPGWEHQAYGSAPYPQPQRDSNVLSILAMVFGGIAVLFVPIVFGLVAIVLAFIARSRHERLSSTAMKVAIGGTLLGFTLGLLIATA